MKYYHATRQPQYSQLQPHYQHQSKSVVQSYKSSALRKSTSSLVQYDFIIVNSVSINIVSRQYYNAVHLVIVGIQLSIFDLPVYS